MKVSPTFTKSLLPRVQLKSFLVQCKAMSSSSTPPPTRTEKTPVLWPSRLPHPLGFSNTFYFFLRKKKPKKRKTFHHFSYWLWLPSTTSKSFLNVTAKISFPELAKCLWDARSPPRMPDFFLSGSHPSTEQAGLARIILGLLSSWT